MTFRLLRYIRRQSREVREAYAFAGAVVAALGVGLFWLVQLPSHITTITTYEPEQANALMSGMTFGEPNEDSRLVSDNFFSRMQASLADFDLWISWSDLQEEQVINNNHVLQAEHEQMVSTEDHSGDKTNSPSLDYGIESVSGSTSTNTSTESSYPTTTSIGKDQIDVMDAIENP